MSVAFLMRNVHDMQDDMYCIAQLLGHVRHNALAMISLLMELCMYLRQTMLVAQSDGGSDGG